MFYWFLKFFAIGPLLKLIFRPWAEGTENVPKDGPVILASNHLSYSDWLFMPLVMPRRVTFVAPRIADAVTAGPDQRIKVLLSPPDGGEVDRALEHCRHASVSVRGK